MSSGSFGYLAPLLLVIAANSCYHFLSKSTPANVNCFLGLSATYGVAFLLSLVLFALSKHEAAAVEVSRLSPANFLLGVVVLGVENGWLLVYRSGWPVSRASLIANICVAFVLFLVGVFVLKEGISAKQAVGFLVCVLGVYLINS